MSYIAVSMCIVEIHEMDIISTNKTVTKESKQTKTKTFVGGSEKNCSEWFHKEPPSNFHELFVGGGINCFFYKFLILLGSRSRS